MIGDEAQTRKVTSFHQVALDLSLLISDTHPHPANSFKEWTMEITADKRWLSVAEISEHLGVAQITIYRWLESHKIPAHRVGRQWRFQLEEIDNWVRGGGAKESQAATSKKRSTGIEKSDRNMASKETTKV